MNSFEKIFDKLTNQYDPNKIFNEFLDYSIDGWLIHHKDRGLEFQGREKYYYDLFVEWTLLMDNELENKRWFDYLGVFYEETIQTKYKAGSRGQFFTPSDVCQLMTELTIDKDKDYTGKLVNDCCCGSGRFLLAGHHYMPKAIMIGADLDEVACKMTVLNFLIHGVRGSVLHMNTLSNEFYGAWRVNNYLGYGLNVPHIELVNERDAYHFIGGSVESKPIEVNKNHGTVQSTLI